MHGPHAVSKAGSGAAIVGGPGVVTWGKPRQTSDEDRVLPLQLQTSLCRTWGPVGVAALLVGAVVDRAHW